MSAGRFLFHATAIVVGKTGILFCGPSGSGKSELAFSFMTEAKRCGLSCALVADDQLFLSYEDGAVIADRPDEIAGLIELRGSGIVRVESVARAVIHRAVTAVPSPQSPRLPPDGETLALPGGGALPLLRIPLASLTPYGKFVALVGDLFKSMES